MNDEEKSKKVFTGTEIEVNLLKEILAQNGITALIKNNNKSGIMAGFYGGASSAIELYIQEIDEDRAKPIIEGFEVE